MNPNPDQREFDFNLLNFQPASVDTSMEGPEADDLSAPEWHAERLRRMEIAFGEVSKPVLEAVVRALGLQDVEAVTERSFPNWISVVGPVVAKIMKPIDYGSNCYSNEEFPPVYRVEGGDRGEGVQVVFRVCLEDLIRLNSPLVAALGRETGNVFRPFLVDLPLNEDQEIQKKMGMEVRPNKLNLAMTEAKFTPSVVTEGNQTTVTFIQQK